MSYKIVKEMFRAFHFGPDKTKSNDKVFENSWYYHGYEIARATNEGVLFRVYDSVSTLRRIKMLAPVYKISGQLICRGLPIEENVWYHEDVSVDIGDLRSYLSGKYPDPGVAKEMLRNLTRVKNSDGEAALQMCKSKFPRHKMVPHWSAN